MGYVSIFTHTVTDVASGDGIFILLTITAVLLQAEAPTSTTVLTVVVVVVVVAERWSEDDVVGGEGKRGVVQVEGGEGCLPPQNRHLAPPRFWDW